VQGGAAEFQPAVLARSESMAETPATVTTTESDTKQGFPESVGGDDSSAAQKHTGQSYAQQCAESTATNHESSTPSDTEVPVTTSAHTNIQEQAYHIARLNPASSRVWASSPS
jgi:hypothetical protein